MGNDRNRNIIMIVPPIGWQNGTTATEKQFDPILSNVEKITYGAWVTRDDNGNIIGIDTFCGEVYPQ